ncbi:MAG: alpha/beta hydrolase [Epsilonproteobacteria bacterium]|nr:alpha/beta hydrolase [Campylobacterota bacterium]
MVKKTITIVGLYLILGTQFLFADNAKIEELCEAKKGNFIYADGECIEFYKADGDKDGALNIIVHGNWPDGTNIIGRYTPFVDNIAMATDTITVVVALPGYSKSSSNKLKTLAKGENNRPLAATKEYIHFMEELVISLKNKYDASTVNYIGHSAGAIMGATLSGKNPDLIQNIALIGGRYNIHEISKDKALVGATDVINDINKDMNIVLTYGTKDIISPPKVTKDFYSLAKSKGFKIKLVEVKDGEHVDLDMSDESVKSIVNMLEK